jgi:hypothetical protein
MKLRPFPPACDFNYTKRMKKDKGHEAIKNWRYTAIRESSQINANVIGEDSREFAEKAFDCVTSVKNNFVPFVYLRV